MGTQQQIVRVETEGVAQARAQVNALDADMQRVIRDASAAEQAAKRAQGAGALSRFSDGTFLTRQGLKLGPATIGRGGVKLLQATQALQVVRLVEAGASAMDKTVDLYDAFQDNGFSGVKKVVKEVLSEDANDAAQRGLALGTAPLKVWARVFGVRGDVFDLARQKVSNQIQEFYTGNTQDLTAVEARTKQLEAENAELAKKRELALQEALAKAEEHFAKSQAGLDSKRPVGFMFRHRSDFVKYREALHKKNEPYDKMVKEEQIRQAKKRITGAGS
jgi:hypothetical protein